MNLSRRFVISAGAAALIATPARPRPFPGTTRSSVVCIPITSDSQITGPGFYCLTADVAGPFNVTSQSNVTLYGNSHTITGLLTVGNGNSPTGLFVHDLTVGALQVTGSVTSSQIIPPIIHVQNIAVVSSSGVPAVVVGSNVLVDNCNFGGNISTTDDPCQLWTGNPNSYVTFNNCIFGPCFDVGLEGLGSWDHCTLTNNASPTAGFGGFYGPNFGSGDHSLVFSFTNCTFTGNTVAPASGSGVGFNFARRAGGSLFNARSDLGANTEWGPNGNVFASNIYPP